MRDHIQRKQWSNLQNSPCRTEESQKGKIFPYPGYNMHTFRRLSCPVQLSPKKTVASNVKLVHWSAPMLAASEMSGFSSYQFHCICVPGVLLLLPPTQTFNVKRDSLKLLILGPEPRIFRPKETNAGDPRYKGPLRSRARWRSRFLSKSCRFNQKAQKGMFCGPHCLEWIG